MAITFRNLPKGSTIGSGSYVFRHYGDETPAVVIPDLCFTAKQAGSTVAMSVNETPTKGQAFETSTDGINWSVFIPGTTTITLTNVGDKVYFRGDNTTVSESTSVYYSFVMTGKIAASGNIMSLLDKTCESTTISNTHCFYKMFYNCTSLTTAPTLPATTLTDFCYSYIFYNCALTTAPVLPATTLTRYCYSNMFQGCKSLTTAPVLPVVTLAGSCYSSMFYNCTSLTTAPTLPATTLETYCYQNMFYGCTSLTTAPTLPATTLANGCYRSMFSGCKNLTTAPALPATTLANYCYYSMFSGCKNLTTAPALPATTLAERCYYYMFQTCTSLTTAPVLPATTLANYCYHSMFYGCTSLTTAPVLPATTLASNCYGNMFNSCTSLHVHSTSFGNYTKAWRIPKWGTASSYTSQTKMFYGCPGSYESTTSVELNKTFYTQNTPVE